MAPVQLSLVDENAVCAPEKINSSKDFIKELKSYRVFGKVTAPAVIETKNYLNRNTRISAFVNEFWTAKQRAAHSLHEVSYRACFKPQLPQFFISRLTSPGDMVYDPFMGRGTTLLQASLMGRIPVGCDVNPLSKMLIYPRLQPPMCDEVYERLRTINFHSPQNFPEDFLVFYHKETLREICALRAYLIKRQSDGVIDSVDEWIRMVAVNRLTGHSPGFFSVYTLPPNQAVSIDAQRKINAQRRQVPPRRNVPELILLKTKALLADCDSHTVETLKNSVKRTILLTQTSDATPQIPSNSIALVVTSPPFLDVVDYASDNWLRGWFCDVDTGAIKLTVPAKLHDWEDAMEKIFSELQRVLRPGGYIAFEVGEVRGGKIKLEESVIPCGMRAKLKPVLVLINAQKFTKTANCWGVNNNEKGTNTNRIVLFQK